MPKLGDFSARFLNGGEQSFSVYTDKVVLVVNVASACGYTPQYDGLEALWRRYRDRGLVVMGFPCNQFGNQEAGTELEIAAFCNVNYDVTFPMFGKVAVNGADAPPLYKWLKRKAPGLLGVQAVPWNFTKFLVGRDGTTVKRYASIVKPEELVDPIEAALGPIAEKQAAVG